jgi:hypothetical protein
MSTCRIDCVPSHRPNRIRRADADARPDVPTALDGRWARGRRSLYATVTWIVFDAVLPSAYVTVSVTS